MHPLQRSLSSSSHRRGSAGGLFDPLSPVRRQRSSSLSNCVIEKERGFRPSDRFDPVKREFLLELGKKIWHQTVRERLMLLKDKKKMSNVQRKCERKS